MNTHLDLQKLSIILKKLNFNLILTLFNLIPYIEAIIMMLTIRKK